MKNKVVINKNSSGNTILQGVDIHAPIMVSAPSEAVGCLAEAGNFKGVQTVVSDFLQKTAKLHPLYPTFSAKPAGDFCQLISFPETQEAKTKYPKRIKGTFQVSRSDYPHMDEMESPWDYAYRTQTIVKIKPTSYQEYLGDIEDPFPSMEFDEEMQMVIKPPPFPPEREAVFMSGTISISFQIKRKPCMEFGKIAIEAISKTAGLVVVITVNEKQNNMEFKLEKMQNCNLITQLQREQFISELAKTKRIKITVEDNVLVESTINDTAISNNAFSDAPYMVRYIKLLISIEQHLSCQFDSFIKQVTPKDFLNAYILAAAIEEKWYSENLDFDNSIRMGYACMPIGMLENSSAGYDKFIKAKNWEFALQGVCFKIDQYDIVFRNAQVNNINSIKKACRAKRSNILITFKPILGNEFFTKYHKYTGIHVQS